MKIINYVLSPALVMAGIFFYFDVGLDQANSWLLVLIPVILSLAINFYNIPELELKTYIKIKEETGE